MPIHLFEIDCITDQYVFLAEENSTAGVEKVIFNTIRVSRIWTVSGLEIQRNP